ncbi:MAG TPA: hypothetical protein VLH56_05450, partial [Dissulfurispiraceae bacterium]|nr:hypothetical protein [Dissulfurispiraceae bacterium]
SYESLSNIWPCQIMQKTTSAPPLPSLRAAIHPQASKPWGFLAVLDKSNLHAKKLSSYFNIYFQMVSDFLPRGQKMPGD